MAEYTKIETVRAIICDMCKCLYPGEDCPEKCDWMEYLKEDAADVAPVVHGRKIENGNIGCFGLCSLCSECLPYGANYCPHCGARMDGDSDAE